MWIAPEAVLQKAASCIWMGPGLRFHGRNISSPVDNVQKVRWSQVLDCCVQSFWQHELGGSAGGFPWWSMNFCGRTISSPSCSAAPHFWERLFNAVLPFDCIDLLLAKLVFDWESLRRFFFLAGLSSPSSSQLLFAESLRRDLWSWMLWAALEVICHQCSCLWRQILPYL